MDEQRHTGDVASAWNAPDCGPLTCHQCHRVNPADARYCYFDGVALAGSGGPVHVGQQPFLSPLVLSSGRSCRNFDELALACHDEPREAIELLKQGTLANFLGNIGRLDLALLARRAAQAVDARRGLHEFLGGLPGDVLKEPKLHVQPLEVNLGQLQVGEDRHFSVHLTNRGMRLLYGSITSECDWLFVGTPPGVGQKLFEFEREQAIALHVRGQNLRASKKPVEGTLRIESNGGIATVLVRAEVPIKPFANGVLAGATSPREVVERAKADPEQAAAYFASGAVARWYHANGWIYPASEPWPTGVAAVQQFFEVHRLTRPPKVELSALHVQLQGHPGQRLVYELKALTKERQYVYAHAVSKDPWLVVGDVRNQGASAAIPLIVPAIPGRAGDTYSTSVSVTTNGNRRFTVPVSLSVTSGRPGVADVAAPASVAKGPQPATAGMPRTFNLWIVETNTVYKEVPFAVVADWVQQGRLLADDQLRAPNGEWAKISDLPAFSPYLPKREPFRAEDEAEALEAVHGELAWRRRDDEEEDVDMIPLIDISLVLLIFFMMTATVGLAGMAIDTPAAEYSWLNNDPAMLAVGIDRRADGVPVYQLGEGDRSISDTNLSEEQLLAQLDDYLGKVPGQVDVRITAHREIKYSVVQAMTVKLEGRKPKVRKVYAEVSEKTP